MNDSLLASAARNSDAKIASALPGGANQPPRVEGKNISVKTLRRRASWT